MEADGAEDSIKPPQKPRRKYKIMANFNMVSTEQTPQSKLLALNFQGTTNVCNQPLGIKEDGQFQAKELLLKTENQIKDIPTTPIFTCISAPYKLQDTEQHGGTDLNTCLYSASVDNFVPSPVQDFNFSRKSGIMNIPENVFVETERTHKNVSVQTNLADETYFYEADDLKNCRGDVNYSVNKLLGSDFKIVADMKEAEEHSEDTITEIDLRVEKAQKQDIDLPKIKDYFDNKMKKSKLEDSKPDHIIINMEGLCQHRSPDIFEDSEENQFIETKNNQSRNFSSGALNPGEHKTTSSRATTDTQRNEDTSPEEVTSSHEITNTLNMIEKNTDYIGNNEKMEICSDSSIPSSIPSTILNSKSAATKEVQYSASDVSAADTTEKGSKRWENEINDTTEIFTDTEMPSPVLSKRIGSIEEKEFCSHRFTKKDTRYSENETFSRLEGYIEEKATVNNSRKDGSFVSHNAAYNREFSKYGESDSHEKYSMSYSRTAHSSNNESQASGYRHESRGYRKYGETDYFQKPHLHRKYLPTLMDNPSELIPVRSSVCHQVLFKEANDVFNTQEGSMIQRHAFILPCDPNLKTSTGETRWDIIKETLVRKFWSLKDLSSALTVLNSLNKRNFKSEKLETFFIRSFKKETFFSDDLPLIAKLALRLPELFLDNPWLLKKGYNLSISMTQEQAACLVAHMFFCSYPDRVLKSYPDRIDFQSLYSRLNERVMREKLRCLINYLSYVARYFHGERRQFDNAPLGVVTITRQAVEEPNWIGMEKEIGITLDVVTDGAIEDDEGLLHVDFANRYIGGGVLGHGAVQEEIRFVICPELLVTLLLCESMDNNESIFIIGCQRYNSYSGYGKSFSHAGYYKDTTLRDIYKRKMTKIVAIDATYFSRGADQFSADSVKRELLKAYAGFSCSQGPNANLAAVATGNWGCGAFKGESKLKAVIQILACSATGRSIRYYTFGDLRLKDDLEMIFGLIDDSKISIASLYKIVMNFCRRAGQKDGEKFVRFITMSLTGVDSDDVSSSDEELPSNQVPLVESNHYISTNPNKLNIPTRDSDDDSEEPDGKDKDIGGWKTHPQENIWNSGNKLKETLLANGNIDSDDDIEAIIDKEKASTFRSVQDNLNEGTVETSSAPIIDTMVKPIRSEREEKIDSYDYESGGDYQQGYFNMLDNYSSNARAIESGPDNLPCASSLTKEAGRNAGDLVMQKANRLPKTLASYANPQEKKD